MLGQGVFEMLTRLLGIADSVCVGGACNILKVANTHIHTYIHVHTHTHTHIHFSFNVLL